jgi:hypothetical protein
MLVYLADPYYSSAYAQHVLAYSSYPYYSLAYALHMHELGRLGLVPGLRGGLGLGVRVRVSSEELGGGPTGRD